MELKKIKKLIEKHENILIATHINPDADGIGAALALLLGIKKMGREFQDKNVKIMIDDQVPKNLKFLEGIENIEQFSKESELGEIDFLISVDAAGLERIGGISHLKDQVPILNIDHHVSNTEFGDYNYIDSKSASTCEIIFELLEEWEVELDKAIAEALYSGIVNDTGNFSHDNVRKSTFKIAAKLVEAGANNNKIVTEIRKNKSFAAMKLLGRALGNFVFLPDVKVIYAVITQKDFKEFNGDKFDTDGVVEELLSLQEAEISIFLREELDGKFKGSMRSKVDSLDLNDVVGMFGGGGHKKAAGFSSELEATEIVGKVVEKIREIR